MAMKPTSDALEQRIRVLEKESARGKHAEEELQAERHKLGERVKELKCLYDLTELIEKPGISLEGILQGTADILYQGWQYPDIARARIVWEGRQYTSRNFKEGKWRQAADIEAHGSKIGVVEIFYLEEMPEFDEGPFLKEERNLINAITKRLGRIIQLRQAEKTLTESYALQNSIVESPKDVVIFALDRQYRYIAFNENHNKTMKQIWGVDIALGNSMLEYIKNPEDCLKAKNNFDSALSGESFTVVEEYGDTALERRFFEDIYNPIIDGNGNVIGLTLFLTDITERRLAALEKEKLIAELQQALADVKTLSGMLPICANCKKIRDDKGYWNQIESYISKHSDTVFSHSICPECARKLYPELLDEK
jgi:PAS domain-containing protein